jgi:hypothetical protein
MARKKPNRKLLPRRAAYKTAPISACFSADARADFAAFQKRHVRLDKRRLDAKEAALIRAYCKDGQLQAITDDERAAAARAAAEFTLDASGVLWRREHAESNAAHSRMAVCDPSCEFGLVAAAHHDLRHGSVCATNSMLRMEYSGISIAEVSWVVGQCRGCDHEGRKSGRRSKRGRRWAAQQAAAAADSAMAGVGLVETGQRDVEGNDKESGVGCRTPASTLTITDMVLPMKELRLQGQGEEPLH